MNFLTFIVSILSAFPNQLQATNQPFESYTNNLKIADICTQCESLVNPIIDSYCLDHDKDSTIKLTKKACNSFITYGPSVCEHYVDSGKDQLFLILDNKPTAKRICSIILQSARCVDPDEKKWVIPLPPSEPEICLKPIEGGNELKILHLTDFHYDPLYTPGSNAKCDESLCCQSGTPSSPENAAGFWGDYNVCDMPWHSITNLIDHIKSTHEDLDFVYFTGDIISHTWLTSKEENTETIRDINKFFREKFNIPVYPILGNHEPHPAHLYASENVNGSIGSHWVFDVVAEEWSSWLPDSARDTILKGGYYSVIVKPGLRIIALNSNVCYTYNMWLVYNDEDPYGQLKWLVEQLTEAESNNEYVHILSHIPPGDTECHTRWSNQFRRIVNRFARTISAQFNGHTHLDELRVFYNLTNCNQVINVAFNGGSFTTYVGMNPNYRVLSVEAEKYTVSDYDQYTFNITEANACPNKSPNWYKLYSFKDAWGLSELTLDNLGKLMEDMKANETLVQQYYRFSVRDSDVLMKEGCNSTCLEHTLCSITAVDANEAFDC